MAFKRSQRPVVMQSIVDALLASLSARPAAELLPAPNIHLFVNNQVISPQTILTDLTQATFAGYAAVAADPFLGPVTLDPNTRGVHVEADFVAGSVVLPGETVYGYYVTDATNADLWIAEAFLEPVLITSVGDFLSLDVIIGEPFQRNFAS